jgi:hypothetical protein
MNLIIIKIRTKGQKGRKKGTLAVACARGVTDQRGAKALYYEFNKK